MSNEFRRILFGNRGGFPIAQEDVAFLQDSLSDNMGMLAVAACLGQNSVIFGGAPAHTGSTMDIAACTVLLDGIMMACPAQSVAGTSAANFWMTPESATGTPLQFLDGSTHDTRETRTAKIVYADAQPAGGVRVTGIYTYSQLMQSRLIMPLIPTGLAQLAERSYNNLTDRPPIPETLPANGGNADTVGGKHSTDFATSAQGRKADSALQSEATVWKDLRITANSTWTAHGDCKYRFNAIGNLEVVASVKNTAPETQTALFTFQESDKWTIAFGYYNDYRSVVTLNATGTMIHGLIYIDDTAFVGLFTGTSTFPAGTNVRINQTFFKK